MNIINKFLMESADGDTAKEKNGRRQSVKVFIISDTKKILFLRIQNGCGGEGKWDLPGGGIEDNETNKDAVIREVQEETSLKISNVKKLREKKGKLDIPETGIHSDWIFYIADADNLDVHMNPSHWEKLHGSPEHNEYKWVDQIWELEQMSMCDDFKRIAKKLLKKFQKESKK